MTDIGFHCEINVQLMDRDSALFLHTTLSFLTIMTILYIDILNNSECIFLISIDAIYLQSNRAVCDSFYLGKQRYIYSICDTRERRACMNNWD